MFLYVPITPWEVDKLTQSHVLCNWRNSKSKIKIKCRCYEIEVNFTLTCLSYNVNSVHLLTGFNEKQA